VKHCLACGKRSRGRLDLPRCGCTTARCDGLPAFAPGLVHGVGGQGGFEVDAFEALAQLEEGSFWFQARNDPVLWALGSYAPRARSFLEVGCGTGIVLEKIGRARPDMRLVGSELLAAGLGHAACRVP
jgi:hypothetical protein